ncbi:2-phospho-L-lactate guanylyltransferase [Tsukamurella sp. 8F]|uniref:2-phospho-L-lactate guanylyltransferase n=1 Tax=Tsukamurella sp. 8F TaxID=3031961 RepID=UPI0023B8F4AB|nr:2-phospho-L-lactate guanylyltransferase [Tsukamurella sp. 8F]MDF0586130.1 2-phospho-L-lactate guanylyltransferase [Tsukamurella sp. 8F]
MTSVVAVTAVKSLAGAKSRLSAGSAPDGGRPQDVPALVLAMLADTVAAATAAGIGPVYVVSPDPTVHAAAATQGAIGLPEPDGGGLNPALAAGARTAQREHPGAAVLALQPDLPALTPRELTAFLTAADHVRAFVPDRQGSGTAALLAPAGTALDPRFGVDSAARHRASGALAVEGDWPGLRGDVDTMEDLAAAAGMVGSHTATLLADPLPPTGRSRAVDGPE